MSAITTVAVTGATGFVGREVVRQLLGAGLAVRALVRDLKKAREVLPASDARLHLVKGDALDGHSPAKLIEGAQACINLIGILRAGGGQTFEKAHVQTTTVLLAACKASPSTSRFLQMSALGVSADGCCDYQRTKWAAEQLVRHSGLDWTIFRPSLIHGEHGEFVELAVTWAGGEDPPYFFMPYFSRVTADDSVPLGPTASHDPLVQPVTVEDVAAAFVAALSRPDTIGEIYNLVGSQTLSWPQLLRAVRDNVPGASPKIQPLGIPAQVGAAAAVVASAVGLGWALPFDKGMALMGAQDSTASGEKAERELGVKFRPFTETFSQYASRL